MTKRSAERRIRQETGWPAGGPLLHVPTIRRITDTFLFISHTTNIFLFKSHCNIVIGVRTVKELPGLVGSGTPCIYIYIYIYRHTHTHSFYTVFCYWWYIIASSTSTFLMKVG
jgi:hypothetical protein